MEILLKWNPDRESDTTERHRATAVEQGSTWWGCWSRNADRSIASDRLALLERQLADGVATRAFAYRLGAQREVWQAGVTGLAQDPAFVDRARRPKGMNDGGCFLFVELSGFEPVDPGWPETSLALWDQPEAGALTRDSLHNRTSPMYVFELP